MTALALIQYPSPEVNPALVYLASLAPGSRPTMLGSLRVVADMLVPGAEPDQFPWHLVRYQHTQAVRAQLSAIYNYTTANKILTALRRVLKEAWRLGHMDSESYHRATDVANVPGSGLSQAEKGRHIAQRELLILFNVCNDGSKAGARDAAVIAVAYSGGLRRAEIAKLEVGDYNREECEITIHGGKRNKTRLVPLPFDAGRALDDWLTVRGQAPGPLFTRIRKGDTLSQERFSADGAYGMLKRRVKQAGLPWLTPHDMRRSYISDLLDAGADIATVQGLAGHSDPKTTASYDRRGRRAKKDAAARLNVPYGERYG